MGKQHKKWKHRKQADTGISYKRKDLYRVPARDKTGKPVRAFPNQPLNIKRIFHQVRVKGRRFDIRRLAAKRDSVQIFGFDGKNVQAIRTDKKGRLEVVPRFPFLERVFREEKFFGVETQDDWLVLPPQDTSTQVTYSYAFVNRGEHPALARVELGPTVFDFAIDREVDVNARQTVVIVPTRFLRFTRVSVRAKEAGKQTRLDIYFQSQSIG
ncbi:DUF6385 domain-containing protein [Effusibacillus pohliae]|uniref:DUF6385 domain-containing protein n=1 Tax=Effusibacillus pohliae TaxID=232270 RepID=UPI0003A9C741|nr:DUF6385 domain-containing protein [Effusibacillus pohliae]